MLTNSIQTNKQTRIPPKEPTYNGIALSNKRKRPQYHSYYRELEEDREYRLVLSGTAKSRFF